ncbi:hypothetical protein LD112_05525 [Pantoea agglomerans]|nr:hypothetical protein [Pantoea agglomerans]
MYHLKQRVIAFAGGIFFMGLAAGISYLGMYKLTEYLSYPDVVNFSFWVFFAAAFFFFFLSIISDAFSCCFYRKADKCYIRQKITEGRVYHLRAYCPWNVYLFRKIHSITHV